MPAARAAAVPHAGPWRAREGRPVAVSVQLGAVGSAAGPTVRQPCKSLEARNATIYTLNVIRTFAHKGLEGLFRTGSKAGIQPAHATKLRRLLAQLDQADSPQDMNLPGWRLHPLSGDLAEHWSTWVNGSWRLTFRFENGDAILVDYRDDH